MGQVKNTMGQIKKAYTFYGVEVSPHLLASLNRYLLDRVPTGSALRAILSNDLTGVLSYADADTFAQLRAIHGYIYNQLPGGVWGSHEKVKAHLDGHSPYYTVNEDGHILYHEKTTIQEDSSE